MTTGTVLEKTACLGEVKPKCLPVKGSHFYIRLSVNIIEGTNLYLHHLYFHDLRRDQKGLFLHTPTEC